MSVSYSAVLWPWSGYLGVSLSVSREAKDWSGEVQGHIAVSIASMGVSVSVLYVCVHVCVCVYQFSMCVCDVM